jgi:hypothetical protein
MFTSAHNSKSITIRGRGILSGERVLHPSQAADDKALVNLCGSDITVEGVTFVNPPTYALSINAFWNTGCGGDGAGGGAGRGVQISNVKVIAWYFLTDGVFAGRDAIIEDSFFKVNDDAIKIFQSNTLVRRCTVWQLDNGQCFMMSWITPTDESNITVTDSAVIHVEHAKVSVWNYLANRVEECSVLTVDLVLGSFYIFWPSLTFAPSVSWSLLNPRIMAMVRGLPSSVQSTAVVDIWMASNSAVSRSRAIFTAHSA